MFKMAESEIQIPTRDTLETEVLTIKGSTSGLNPFTLLDHTQEIHVTCSKNLCLLWVTCMCSIYEPFKYHMQQVPHVCHMCTNATMNIFLEKVWLQILATIYLSF